VSIDNQVDAPLSAVAALVRGAIQADLGADVLVKVFEDPRNLFTIAALDLPALCVHRAAERSYQRNSTQLVDQITVAFEYALPSTSRDEQGGRWPTLQAVWRSLRRALLAGKHPAVSSGVDVLAAAGSQTLRDSARVVQYTLAEGGRDTEPALRPRHPIFMAQAVIEFVEPEVDVLTLNDFLRFHMSFDEPGGDHTEPLIVLDVTLPAYGS
jgi:hypothetical protein